MCLALIEKQINDPKERKSQKKYYKVVGSDNTSYMVGFIPSTWTVTYGKMYEWIYPKKAGTKLFVCGSLERAIFFAGHGGYNKIYEVEVQNPQKIKYAGDYHNRQDMEIFWKARRNKKRIPSHCRILDDTVLCDCLKLVKEVVV